jgi:hypothetical protein
LTGGEILALVQTCKADRTAAGARDAALIGVLFFGLRRAEVVAQLAPYPIQASAAQIAALSVVIFITVAVDGDNITRRVSSIVSFTVDPVSGGLIATRVAL